MINKIELESEKVCMNKKVVGILTLLFMIPLMVACGSQQESQTSETSTTAPGLRKEPYAQEQFLLGTYTRIRVYDEGKEAAINKITGGNYEFQEKYAAE